MYYIYALQNKINNKIYIGQTNSIKRRMREHRAQDRLKKKTPIYTAIGKYGFENFNVIEIESFNSTNEIDEAEEFWIQYFNTRDRNIGYNLAIGGKVNRGNKWTDDMKKNHSNIKKEYFNSNPKAEETRKLLRRPRGISSVNAKFTKDEVANIRKEFCNLSLNPSIEKMALFYKVDSKTMRGIVYNKSYKDVNYIISNEVLNYYNQNKNKQKITKQINDDIIYDYKNNKMSIKNLSLKYKVSKTSIYTTIKNI